MPQDEGGDFEIEGVEMRNGGHHDNVGKTIEEFEKLGWKLHAYSCAGNANLAFGTNHYLLLEREK